MNENKFKIEFDFSDFKKIFEKVLHDEIKRQVDMTQTHTIFGEKISEIFKIIWSNKSSEIKNQIEDALMINIRQATYNILQKEEIKNSIEFAIEENLKDTEFIKKLVSQKTKEILNINDNRN